jgi:hypothetical protein
LASQAAAHAHDADGDDFDDDVQEEVLFESPLDEINPYIRFSDCFRGKKDIEVRQLDIDFILTCYLKQVFNNTTLPLIPF